MARARNIKPSFFQNEELGDLQPLARLAFIGMWTIANFKGCIEYRAKRLKIQLLPYDECNIEKIVNDLDKSGLIRLYSVHENKYIKIVNFEKHQNPHKNERDAGTEIPDIDENDFQNNELKNIQKNPEQDGTDRADSLILNPDSCFLNPDLCEINPLFGFEEFWLIYDKKVARQKSEKEWAKIGVNEQLLQTIILATRNYVKAKPDKQFRKDPERWIKNQCWNDEIVFSGVYGYESAKDKSRREFNEQIWGNLNNGTIIDITESDS
jgi:hypothetical protein